MIRKTTTKFATLVGLAFLSLTGLLLTGCGGSTKTPDKGSEPPGGAALVSVEYGRLVDIYAYRRIDPIRDDRRDVANRQPFLIAKDVVVRADIESSQLFDASGNARLDADYRFLPFDVQVGHEELLILWDDQVPPEKSRFDEALRRATTGLTFVPGSFRDQNTVKRPMPVIPRNAAICLNFDRDLGVQSQFFTANPNAIQVLEFITPVNGRLSFRPVPVRILSKGTQVVLDTSLIGGEANGGRNTAGLPSSLDNRTANIRVALPTSGVVSKVLRFSRDPVAELNGLDSRGENAVIRDFRSGNLKDGTVGALADVERPMVVTHVKMGITAIDTQNRILTLNKRNQNVAIRGRVPYVDGAIDTSTGFAAGPEIIPTSHPLRAGDVVLQVVDGPTGEKVRIRAEVVMNLDVGSKITRVNGKIEVDPAFKGLGMNRRTADPKLNPDGGEDGFVRLQVTNLTATDSNGNPVTFRSSSFPLGEDCEVKVHYYEAVPYKLQYAGAIDKVSDTNRRNVFLSVDPTPPILDPNGKVNVGGLVNPLAAIAVRFSEPMNLETVESLENFMLTNETINATNLLELSKEPKPMALALLATRLLDHSGDGTLLQLRPPMGHYHEQGKDERYWCHLMLEGNMPRDMAGNAIDIFDRTQAPISNFSVSYTLDPNAESNWVGNRVLRFIAQDEDGSAPGSVDGFGQFQLLDGELRALPVSRFSSVADNAILSGITRFDRGECDYSDGAANPPVPPTIGNPGATAVRFQCPSEGGAGQNGPTGFGGVSEPHNPRGSRLQMTYLEDDFGLGYRDATKHLIDIEQMHWAPFADMNVAFDVFDRYTIRMAHSDWRPDITNRLVGTRCEVDPFSGKSGLRVAFDSNVLSGTTYDTIVKDKVYEINPNDAFRATTGTKFVPYPKFQKTFTWRDPRLIQWDGSSQSATGFGGAHQAAAPNAIRDITSSVSSPYVPDLPTYDASNPAGDDFRPLHLNTEYVYDYGDFIGFRTLDHSPLALPLLIDFSVYPDGPANGGAAHGTNQFHIAEIGPCFGGTGYYSTGPIPNYTVPWPETRAHASGGIDPITGFDIYVDPDTQLNAKASIITDRLLGSAPKFLYKAPPLDDHVHWAQADFVRRVSMVTFGFFDSRRPNALDFRKLTTSWPGRPAAGTSNGIPDFSGNSKAQGIVDLVTMMDPPLSQQPVGTSVVLEFRGAESFDNDGKIFDQPTDLTATDNVKLVKDRGNLLNPLYACEAYRYALTNAFDTSAPYHKFHTNWAPTPGSGPRIPAKGLTPYVTEDRLDSIRLPNALLPRYVNFRVIMENNIAANPPISPALKSLAVAFRLGEPN